jgi:hypothetical protein
MSRYLENRRSLLELLNSPYHARADAERLATIELEIHDFEVRSKALQQEMKIKRRYVFRLSLL